MTNSEDYIELYCLNYKNEERKQRITQTFDFLGINIHFSNGVQHDDPRLDKYQHKMAHSCMYGHLDMINDFYHNTTKDYCICFEDDIRIRKDFKEIIPSIIEEFNQLNLDLLLLGYLTTFHVNENYHGFSLLSEKNGFKFHSYPNDIWGAQMYMISRKYAKQLLDTYYYDYQEIQDKPFVSDFTITKDASKRALISPIVAVEYYDKECGHYGQDNYHKTCMNAHYDQYLHV